MVGSLFSADRTVSLMCPKAPLASWRVRQLLRHFVFRHSNLKKKKKPHSCNASHTNNNNTGQSNCITITPPLQHVSVKHSKWTWQRNHLHQTCYSLEAGGRSRADLIVFGCSLQPLVAVQVLLGGDLTGQSCYVEQHTRLLVAQTGQSCKGQTEENSFWKTIYEC